MTASDGYALSVARFALIGTCAVMVPLVMPLLVAATAQLFDVPTEKAGYVAVAEMLGSGIGATVVAGLLTRVLWRNVVSGAFAIVVAVNLATMVLHDFPLVIGLRVLAGVGAGVCLGVATSGLASLRNAERNLAIFFVLAFAFNAVALRLLPPLVESGGPIFIFYLLISAAVLGLLVATTLKQPERGAGASGASVGSTTASFPSGAAVVGIASILLFFMGIGATWSFFARIGEVAGLSPTVVGQGLAMSAVAGGVGALAAAALAGRISRALLITAGLVSAMITMAILMSQVSETSFALAGVLLLFSWNFTFPFLLGVLAELDDQGRLVPIGVAMSSFGFAAGPALAGALLGSDVGTSAAQLGAVLIGLAAVAVAVVIARARRPAR